MVVFNGCRWVDTGTEGLPIDEFLLGNSQNSLTPNMELEKQPLGKGKTSTHHQFFRFHVSFRGRILWFSIKLNPHVSLGTPRPWSSLEGNLATSRLWHMTEKIQWWPSIHYIHPWFLWMAGPNEGWLLQRCQPCPVCLTLVRREELYKIHAGLVIVIAGYSWKKLTHNHKPLWNLLVSILSDVFFCVNILKLPRYSTHFYVVHNVIMPFMIMMNIYLFVKHLLPEPENWEKPVVVAVAGGMFARVLSLRMWFLLWCLSDLLGFDPSGSFFHGFLCVQDMSEKTPPKKRLPKLQVSRMISVFYTFPGIHWDHLWSPSKKIYKTWEF